MNWKHKDHDIELRGAKFYCTIDGQCKGFSSLVSAQRAIDKRLDEKAMAAAKQVKFDYPVLILDSKNHSYSSDECPEFRIRKSRISSLDPETFYVVFDPPEKEESRFTRDWERCKIFPDTPENEKRLMRYAESRVEAWKAEKDIDGRGVKTFYGYYNRRRGVPQKTYAEGIYELKKAWKSAQKGKSEEC